MRLPFIRSIDETESNLYRTSYLADEEIRGLGPEEIAEKLDRERGPGIQQSIEF